jgi:hypothetical protein
MKTIYKEDLYPIVEELKERAQKLVNEYQKKSGLDKYSEVRLDLAVNGRREVEVHIVLCSLDINLIERTPSVEENS